jgi:hypothetical protein
LPGGVLFATVTVIRGYVRVDIIARGEGDGMRNLGAALALVVLVLGTVIGVKPATAQDATPASDPCAPLTRDEVVTLTQSYLQAIQSGNALAIDIILDDDVTHNLAEESANLPGNDDEAALLAPTAGAEFTTERTLIDDQTAVVRYAFSFRDGAITGSAIVIISYECGQVADIQQESTELGRQAGLAEAAAEATPES